MIDRRGMIAGGAMLMMAAGPPADAFARTILDRAVGLTPAERSALLREVNLAGLSAGLRLDVEAAMRAAELEVRIAAAPPAERYALQLRLQAGFDITPQAAHRRALECARTFTQKADRLLRAQGLAIGTVADRLRVFARDPRFLYADDEVGRDRAVADMNLWLAAARARLPEQFGRIPPAALQVTIVRMTPAEEAAGTAGYRSLSQPDQAVPGAYHVDLHEIGRRPSWSLPSVVHHETLPGHMIQLVLQSAAGAHSLRLKASPGFFEGWAIYAEQLAADRGAYAADPSAQVGYCQWMLFRLGRALADTGINHLGWPTGQAVEMLRNLQGDPVVFASFEKDVARITAEPAGFAGQALNWLEIERKRAARTPVREAAGLRAFHDRLLRHGPAPLIYL